MTKVELVQLLKDNLADNRLYGFKLFLEELIERKTHGSGIEQYRVHTLTPSVLPGGEPTKTPIVSLDDFLANISPDDLDVEFKYGGYKVTGTNTAPFELIITNLVVELDHASDEDAKYIRIWGGSSTKKNISVIVSYVNDNDKELPLKIVNISLG